MELTVVGFPRSGTNFLTRLLAYYVNDPAKVTMIHFQYQLERGATAVHIVRDPRDTAVSGLFYYVGHFGWIHRHDISNFSLLDFLVTGFSKGFKGLDDRVLWPCGWKEHTKRWLAKDTVRTSYERLMEDRAGELKRLLSHLEIPEDDARLRYTIEQSYNIGGLRMPYVYEPGWADADKTVHPTVGEWKKHFGAREKAFIQEYCGDLMHQLGYE